MHWARSGLVRAAVTVVGSNLLGPFFLICLAPPANSRWRWRSKARKKMNVKNVWSRMQHTCHSLQCQHRHAKTQTHSTTQTQARRLRTQEMDYTTYPKRFELLGGRSLGGCLGWCGSLLRGHLVDWKYMSKNDLVATFGLQKSILVPAKKTNKFKQSK